MTKELTELFDALKKEHIEMWHRDCTKEDCEEIQAINQFHKDLLKLAEKKSIKVYRPADVHKEGCLLVPIKAVPFEVFKQ